MKSRSSMLVVFVILLTLMLCRPGFVVSAADITSLPASGTWSAGRTGSYGLPAVISDFQRTTDYQLK